MIIKTKNKVNVGGVVYERQIEGIPLPHYINPSNYALIFKDGKPLSVISMQQGLNGLGPYEMLKRSFEIGLQLTSAREFTPFHRDVNLALQSKGVVYDATGRLIEGDRLVQLGDTVNNACIFLNSFLRPSQGKDKGFLGLELVKTVGFDGEKPIIETEPLEECVYHCWADIESINHQGYYTQRAKEQKFELGRTVGAVEISGNGFLESFHAMNYKDIPRHNTAKFGHINPRGAGGSFIGGFLLAKGIKINN